MPNSYGTVCKLSGKRRKPYMARTGADRITGQRQVIGYYHTKAEALAALSEYNDNPYAILNKDMTVNQIWNNIKDKVKASDGRKKVYERVFNTHMEKLHEMKIRDVRTTHLQNVIDDCGFGYSTKSNIRTVMKHIFKYAIENDLVKQDYTQYIEFEQESTLIQRQVYTSEEIEKLWQKVDLPEYAITLILLHQGMRIKELRDCKKDWIDLDNNTIEIKVAKNKYSLRTIPIHEKILPLLKKYYYDSETDDIFAFTKSGYEYFVKNVLSHTPYDVRHTFASKCSELGIKTHVIQRIMGHKPETLVEQVYIHLTIEELSEAINKVDYGI